MPNNESLPPAGAPALPQRYRIREACVGGGWIAEDTVVGRDVLIVDVPSGSIPVRAQAIRRIATCNHPNVSSILDSGTDPAGITWIATWPNVGWTLAEAVTKAGRPSESLQASWIDVVQHVAEAVAAVHRLGIIHSAIDPNVVHFDDHGEVSVGGWQHALAINAGPIAEPPGSPLFAAPEQQAGGEPNRSWDVYALGGLLFLALFGRPPQKVEDGEEGSHGQSGAYHPPTSIERMRIPMELAGVAFSALHEKPERRPVDADAFVTALIAARVPCTSESSEEVRAAVPRRFPVGLLAVGLVLVAAAAWAVRFSGIGGWGAPVVAASFVDETWSRQWKVTEGGFERVANALVSQGDTSSVVMFDQRFTPPAAIECTARIEADAPVGDLTLVWCETDPFTPGRIYTKRAYLAQTGAYDNTFAGISGGGHAQLAQTNFILEPGRSYRLRLEVDNEVMQLIVDGQVVAVHRSAMPFGSGWFGMLGYYRGKSFSDVAIYSQTGKQWGPLTVGDAFLTHGHLADAASEYANAATLLESEPTNQAIARYRQGVALAADGHHAEATAIWNTIAISPWMELGAIYALRRWIATGDHATVAAGMTTIGHSQDQRVIDAMREVWGEGLSALGALPNATEVMQYIHVRHACFPNDAVTAWAAAQACWRIGRFKEALAEAGSDRRATAWSLLALGRADEVLATYPEQIQAMGKALLQREKYDIALAAIPQVTWAMREVALATGRFEEASKVVGSGSAELAIFRIVSGEAATIAADPSESQSLRVSAALLMDDLPAVTELANGNPPYEAVMLAEGAAAAIEGRKNAGMDRAAVLICRLLEEPSDPNEIEAIVSELGGWGANATWTDLWFARQVVLPWLKEGGDHVPPALFTDLANLGHVPAPRGECLAKFIIGAMDEAQFLDQPAAMDAKRYLPLAKAMREEVAGNNAAALTAYRGFMALPPWQRPQSGAWMRNVIVEWFARWRIRQLQG